MRLHISKKREATISQVQKAKGSEKSSARRWRKEVQGKSANPYMEITCCGSFVKIVLKLINLGLFFNLIISPVCAMEWQQSLWVFFITVLSMASPGDSSELPMLLLMSLLGLPTLLISLKSFRLMELSTIYLLLCAEHGHGSFWCGGLALANSQKLTRSVPHSPPQENMCRKQDEDREIT